MLKTIEKNKIVICFKKKSGIDCNSGIYILIVNLDYKGGIKLNLVNIFVKDFEECHSFEK